MNAAKTSRNLPSLADIKASQDAMPDDVLDFVDEQATAMKDQPVVFVGREKELRGLENRIARTIQPHAGTAHLTAEMIIAAPGAGKTSLMVELAKRLRSNGVAVVEAHPEDLTDPKRFSDVIRKTPPWSDYTGIKNVGKKITKSFKEAIHSITETTVQTTASVATQSKVEKPDIDLIDRVVDVWRNDGTPDIEDSLRILDHGRAEGCVVMVDEAQMLRDDTQDKNSTPAIVAGKVLRTLSKPKERADLGIQRTVLLLAGLSDTQATVDRLGSPGIEPRVLAPLPPKDVEIVIRNSIKVGSKGNKKLQNRAAKAWVPLLMERYADWTRIAQAGADAARIVLTEYGEQALDALWGLGALVAIADNNRKKVYQAAINRAEKEKVSPLTKDIVAFGLFCNGNKIGAQAMRALIESCIRQEYNDINKSELQDFRDEAILRLLRAGIMDSTGHLPHHHGGTSYYCPIPSLVRHISNQIESDQDIILETLTAARLSTERPKPGDLPFIPTWRKRPDVTEDEDE